MYLFRAGFRTTIYRASEAMTVFAVMTAGLFPILHLGRPWKFFWLIPYPNWRLIWPNPKSPLVWDVFAILTYLTVSATFFYIGLIPDIAVLRDQEKNPDSQAHLRDARARLAELGYASGVTSRARICSSPRSRRRSCSPCTRVVSFDFAMSLVPGWHATIFPPYFVAGAIFSGIGMVFTIIIPLRKFFKLEHYVTINDLDAAAKLCLFTSMVVGLAYLTEFQVAWMSGNRVEQEYFWNRVFGQWWWAAWIMLICNMVLPLSLFSQKLRRNTTWLFILSIFINIGMWFERFVIVIPSLSHEFEPWQWGGYHPTWVDYAILLGSFGWFFMWFLLFIRQLPVMAIAEIKEIMPPKMRASSRRCARSRCARHRSQPHHGRRLMQGVIGAFAELDSTVDAIEELAQEELQRHHGVHPDAAPRVRRGARQRQARAACASSRSSAGCWA